MRGRSDDALDRLRRLDARTDRNRPAGAVIGIVTNNTDPQGWGRVKVRFPWLHDDEESHWARIAQPYAGPGRGSFWLPEVGDEVVVVFDRDTPDHPYVLGGVWNGQDKVPPPGNPDGKNNHKVWRTRNGHQVVFDDTDGGEKITLIDGVSERSLVIDVAADRITITAEPGDITFEAPQNTLSVHCKDLEIEAQNSSTYQVDSALNETCDTRQETITGPDSINGGKAWTSAAPSTSVSATTSSLAADTIGVSVSGGLTMSNMAGREVISKEVRRTSPAETITAAQMEVKADEAVAYVVNGPITVQAGAQLGLDVGDGTITTSAVLTVQGGVVQLQGTGAVTAHGQMVQLC
ncbi:MAG: hypothetical protein H6704_02570 [Myxococcales bacterium]|nr:hypothetical protein [Myxococcales bacterium]MCB9535120.1 hypothetical protein [Myxococcales bacterium]